MGRDDKPSGRRDPEYRRSTSRSGGARKQTSFLVRAFANDKGRSGYGSESVRPYLRAQLKLKELLGGPFTPSDPWEHMVRKKIRDEDR